MILDNLTLNHFNKGNNDKSFIADLDEIIDLNVNDSTSKSTKANNVQ